MGRSNFELNGVLVRRDLYRLVCLVAADSVILETAIGDNDPVMALRDEFLFDEVVHLLVSIATYNRVQLDHLASEKSRRTPSGEECGILQEDVTDGADVPLTFREACNKIIHAVHIVPETAGNPAEHPIGNVFILRGYRDKRAWQAFLNLGKFVRCSVANFAKVP